MADIHKASRIQEREVRTQLDRMEMVEALRHGNIYEVFAKSKVFKLGEFNDFFAGQWHAWRADLIKDTDVKALESVYYEPDITQFSVHHREIQISPEDANYFFQQMGEYMQDSETGRRFGRFKASETGDAAAPTDRMTSEELQDMARGTLGDWEKFMSDTWGQILDAQMMSDYKSKMSEVQNEVRRIFALAKQGVVGPEFLLIAMAKVNSMKNGVLLTWLGKKAFKVNESLSRIANDLRTLSPSDPRYAGELQLAQSKTREGSFNLNLLTSDMQKVMNDMVSVIEQVHTMIAEINRTRREIITKVSAT